MKRSFDVETSGEGDADVGNSEGEINGMSLSIKDLAASENGANTALNISSQKPADSRQTAR